MPFNFAPTEVMTLGKVRQMNVGDFYTQPPNQFLNPPRTSPSFSQNLARQTLNGLGRFGAVALGALPTDIPGALTAATTTSAVEAMPGTTVAVGPTYAGVRPEWSPATVVAMGAVATASSLVSLYHGYKRNNSLGWGLLWGLMGATFPLITPTVALAQGFAVRHGGRR